MNALRVGGVVMYPLPKLAPLAVRASYAHTVTGRNVGQSNTLSLRAGLPVLPARETHAVMPSHSHSSFARLVACALVFAIVASQRAAARRRRQRCRRRYVADGRDDQPGADTRGPARVHVQCRVPGRAHGAQGGAGSPHAGPAAGDRLLEPRRRRALERDHAGAGGARRPAASAERRRHLFGARREQPVRRAAVPVRQPALRGPRLQLRLGRRSSTRSRRPGTSSTSTTARRRRTSTAASARCCRPAGCRPIRPKTRCSRE